MANLNSKTNSFVTYYKENKISPVNQDISDIELHFQRRDTLFRSLGIPPRFLQGKTVLEFGPGSGHNSIYTASLNPSKYELVDANPIGLKNTKSILSDYNEVDITIHDSLFLDFDCDLKFDLVWAENCIPGQADPIGILNHVSNFVKKNGLLVVSLSNGISVLSEVFRRMIYHKFFKSKKDITDQATRLVPFFQNHTRHLKGMSRSTKDWILDNMLQPMFDRNMLGLPDLVNELEEEFDIYSTSPRFLVDWRWYKEVVGEKRFFNEKSLECYYKSNINLLDYRNECAETSIEFGINLERTCRNIWSLSCLYEKNKDKETLEELLSTSEEVLKSIRPIFNSTSKAISQAIDFLKGSEPRKQGVEEFEKWWGRGTQYISLIKK